MTTDTTRLLNAPFDGITLLSLVEAAASHAPKRVFLRDCPERQAWNGVEPRELNFETFQRSAQFLAAQMRTLGVQPGDTVLLLLPNTVETPLAFVASTMAGAIPAIAPADEKVDTLRAMAERCEATAIITMSRIGEIMLGEKARQVAARLINIRCVAGFGFDLPDGIVSLEGWSEEDVLHLTPADVRQDAPALITFARENGAICACRRSQSQLVADMLAVSSLAAPNEEGGILSLMQPGSSASIAAGLLFALQAKVPLAFVGPYEYPALSVALDRQPGALLLAPDHFIAHIRKDDPASRIAARISGTLAVSHVTGPNTMIVKPGPINGPLILTFEERGMLGLAAWPLDGQVGLSAALGHPLDSVIPEDQTYLQFEGDAITGFCAAEVLRRPGSASAGKAA